MIPAATADFRSSHALPLMSSFAFGAEVPSDQVPPASMPNVMLPVAVLPMLPYWSTRLAVTQVVSPAPFSAAGSATQEIAASGPGITFTVVQPTAPSGVVACTLTSPAFVAESVTDADPFWVVAGLAP